MLLVEALDCRDCFFRWRLRCDFGEGESVDGALPDLVAIETSESLFGIA